MNDAEADLICKGNADAKRFVMTFVRYCHLLDDLVDRDKPLDDEEIIGTSLKMLLEIAANQFFNQNKALLMSLIVQGFNAYLDSNRMAQREELHLQHASDVLKGFYHEVVWQTAFIIGGWEHLRSVTKAYRGYDFDHLPETIQNGNLCRMAKTLKGAENGLLR